MTTGDLINWVSAAVGLLSLMIAILQLFQSKKGDFSGQFFTFLTEKHRRCDISFSYVVVGCAFIMISIFVFCRVGVYFDEALGLSNPRELLFVIEMVLWLNIVLNTVLNQGVVFSDFKYLDKWLNHSEPADYFYCVFMLASIFTLIVGGFIQWMNPMLTSSLGYILLAIMLMASIVMIITSFIKKYIALRFFYAICDTKVIIRNTDVEYKNIHNFRVSKGNLIFICESEDILSKVMISGSSGLIIEQTINAKYNLKNYLDLLRKKQSEDSVRTKENQL